MADSVTAIVLAAGFSSRMGEFKPLLPLGGVPALERIVRTFREAGVADVRVVVGHRHEELKQVIERGGGRVVRNRRYQEGMFSSVAAGIRTLGPEVEAFFVHPADVPLVRGATVRRLMEVRRLSQNDVIYPSFLGMRGHPPLVSGRHARAIAGWRGEGGLRGALARWEASALEVAVADEMILRDMDTPDAYRGLAEQAERLEIPSPAECRVLLTIVCGVDERIVLHGQAVARLAVMLGEELNGAGCRLDLPLLAAAGLLHDVARQEPDHARAGAQLLAELGFRAVADLVARHMDLPFTAGEPISEAALLFLADKLVSGERLVSLGQRFNPVLARFAAQPEILRKVQARLATARLIQQRVEGVLGRPLTDTSLTVSPEGVRDAC